MIIFNNSSNIQIRWSNKDLKEMAEINNRCAKENRAIETVLNLLEKKDQQIDLLSETLRYYNGMQQEQCFCIDICGEKECNMKNCKERIKQYVEYKVEEGK